MPELDLATIEQQSVQNVPQVDPKTGVTDSGAFWGWYDQRGPILSPYGTRRRMYELRYYDRYEYNTLWQGARAGLIKKLKATSYELKGGKNLTARFDGILRNAERGAGWGVFLSKFLRDYLRFDHGAFAEIIAPGNPLSAPTGPVTGIAHLDSYHCLPTGNPDYPVVYYNSRPGEKPFINVLHHTRILHLIDQPDGDQDRPGYGECALTRAIAIVQRQILMNRYIVTQLDDKPAPGMMIGNNISREDMVKSFGIMRGEQQNDLAPEWGRVAWFFNLNPAIQASMTAVSFSTPPDKFDYPVYVNLDINELALALGVDKQELWELSSRTGTAGQSMVQADKAEGKAYGEIRASLEREINNKLLPESLEFQWKVRDGLVANQDATTAQVWAGFAASMAPIIGNQLAAQIVASQVEAAADALFDENGQMIRLPDYDPKSPDEQKPKVEAQPNPPAGAAPTGGQQITAQDSTPNATAAKDIQSTRLEFEGDFADLLTGARANEVNRRRFGIILRDLVRKYGKSAYQDGLVDGGVTDGAMDEDDNAAYAVELAKQSTFVTNLGDAIYQTGITDAQAQQKASMWFNGSIAPFYDDGRGSADRNGYYTFHLGSAEHHCIDCPRLDGQTHRFKDWQRKNLIPGRPGQDTECGGWECKCTLTKAEGGLTASGNWLGGKALRYNNSTKKDYDPMQPRDENGMWTSEGGQFFVRYSANPQADLERGHSFIGYTLDKTREEAFQTLAENEGVYYDDDFNMEDFIAENEDRIAQDNVTGLWGTRRSGLNGYGPYESVGEAVADIPNHTQYAGFQHATVFAGDQNYDPRLDAADEGIAFKPHHIARILKKRDPNSIIPDYE